MSTNRIHPQAQSDIMEINQVISQIKIDSVENSTFIMCKGVGSYLKDTCRIKLKRNIKFVTFNYESETQQKLYRSPFIVLDVLCLFNDMKQLAKTEDGYHNNDILKKRTDRLTNLVSQIKTALMDDSMNNIVLIGISHGSILMHAAILRLQIELHDVSLMRKIHFYTIGSPRHPQPWLLSQYEKGRSMKLINFYDVRDKVLQNFTPVLKFFKARNPFMNNIGYKYSLVNIGSLPVFDVDSFFRIIRHTNESVLTALTPVSNYHNDLYHINTYMLYPLFLDTLYLQEFEAGIRDKNYIGYINELKYDDSPLWGLFFNDTPWELFRKDKDGLTQGIQPCSPNEGGGYNGKRRIILIATKKKYIVRIDKDNKKKYVLMGKQNKVYLRDIRGTYRYLA